MNTISYDSLKNILSFLQPREVCKMRYLTRETCRVSNAYLLMTYKTVCIESYVCPSCGNYYKCDENELNHSYFYDLPYGDVEEEERRINTIQKMHPRNEVKRMQLVCDD